MPQFHSGESQRRRRRIVTLPSGTPPRKESSSAPWERATREGARSPSPSFFFFGREGRREGASPEISREKPPSPTPAPAGRSSGFLIFREGRRSVETVPRGLSPLPFSRPGMRGRDSKAGNEAVVRPERERMSATSTKGREGRQLYRFWRRRRHEQVCGGALLCSHCDRRRPRDCLSSPDRPTHGFA